ncbi:MAG: DUF2935 domain-containing protein [Coprococcus sp.]|nr:DUF2935 domain-containing protein [Coprococcus sp.]
MRNYVKNSLETHLFFSRIMKEHALFLEAGFPCKETAWIQKAEYFREQFEKLLKKTVEISDGIIGNCITHSDELVTQFTVPAEKRTNCLTGIPIDTDISVMEQKLQSGNECSQQRLRTLVQTVNQLNERAVVLLNGLIDFKECILEEVKAGRLFTANYPLLIQHILREAKLYRRTLMELRQNRGISYQNPYRQEKFWNQIMMEHALFIRGLLDPSEEQLIDTADNFATAYNELLEMAKLQDARTMDDLTRKSLEETLRYRDFKAAGAEGILDCKIASVILPLLADHVLREANHYIRILDCNDIEERTQTFHKNY